MKPTRHALISALAKSSEVRTLRLFRPPRAALVLPVAKALLGSLKGVRILEIGSGEPLLLAHALVQEGAHVQAIDPALAAPRVEAKGVDLLAKDALEIPLDSVPPAALTLSTLLFGAPLRQRAKRELRQRYLSGNFPNEHEVHEQVRSVERRLLSRLAHWTKPGGWTLHISLERLFVLHPEEWRDLGFEPVLFSQPHQEKPTGDDPFEWAEYALSGAVVARRLG